MRYILLLWIGLVVMACSDGNVDGERFDFAIISDPNVQFCKKVKPVVIFGKSTCPYCQKAISSANARGFEHRFVELDSQNSPKNSAEIIAAHGELTKMLKNNKIDPATLNTVPQIFFGGTYVGGFEDFKKKVFKPMDKLLGAQNVESAVRACRSSF